MVTGRARRSVEVVAPPVMVIMAVPRPPAKAMMAWSPTAVVMVAPMMVVTPVTVMTPVHRRCSTIPSDRLDRRRREWRGLRGGDAGHGANRRRRSDRRGPQIVAEMA